MCPLAAELRRRPGLRVTVCATGQHRELLRNTLEVFGVRPDVDLDLMRPGQSLFDVTAGVLTALRPVLAAARPDLVLVHGDTATAFAAALACFYLDIPLGHVEAGLRSGEPRRPFPEEFNRRAVSLLASFHFAPTQTAAANLRREGIAPERIFVTGNTVVDALRYTLREDYSHPILDWAGRRRLIIVTAHRRESIGAPMRGIFRAVRRVMEAHPDCAAAVPVHPNPAVGELAAAELDGCANILLTAPADAADCHNLEARCWCCLTDSGGMQEECAALGRPVLVLRDVTERPEGVACGAARLAGTAEEDVFRSFSRLLEDREVYIKMSKAGNPYGDGRACERIADVIETGRCRPYIDHNNIM